MSDPLRTDGSRASPPRRKRIATRRSSSSCSPASIITSPHNTTTRSASGRACCFSIAATPGPARTSSGRAARWPSASGESEELLQNGVAAFQRGDGGEARRLVQAAIDGGAPTDEALAVLDRLNRLGTARRRRSAVAVAARAAGRGAEPPRKSPAPLVGAVDRPPVRSGAGGRRSRIRRSSGVRSIGARCSRCRRPPARVASAAIARESGLAPPRRGELALTRARAQAADGHLRDALTTLDLVRPTDPQKADADRLRGEIQLQLIALTSVPRASPPA